MKTDTWTTGTIFIKLHEDGKVIFRPKNHFGNVSYNNQVLEWKGAVAAAHMAAEAKEDGTMGEQAIIGVISKIHPQPGCIPKKVGTPPHTLNELMAMEGTGTYILLACREIDPKLTKIPARVKAMRQTSAESRMPEGIENVDYGGRRRRNCKTCQKRRRQRHSSIFYPKSLSSGGGATLNHYHLKKTKKSEQNVSRRRRGSDKRRSTGSSRRRTSGSRRSTGGSRRRRKF